MALQKMAKEHHVMSARQRRRHPHFEVVRNKETNVVEAFSRKESAYLRAKQLCGFFAFLALGLDWDAEHVLTTFHLLDVQEACFHNMEDKIHTDRQHCWSNRSVHGRRFIEFVALILVSRLNHAWAESEKLRKLFPTVDHLLTEMSRIHCVEHAHRDRVITLLSAGSSKFARRLVSPFRKDVNPFVSRRESVKIHDHVMQRILHGITGIVR